MKILIGINNEYIFNYFRDKYKNNIYKFDISDMESMIKVLEDIDKEKNEEIIVITKDTLDGIYTNKEYIINLRKVYHNLKIIYIVKNLTNELKTFLLSQEIFNIIEGESISIYQLEDCITSDKKIIYKNDINTKMKNSPIPNVKVINTHYISKRTIAVFGTNGAGKSIVSSILAKDLSKKYSNIKSVLLDYGFENSSIDIINNIDNKKIELDTIIEKIDTNNLNDDIVNEFPKDKNYKNLKYLVNNISFIDLKSKLNSKYYEKINKLLYSNFDITLIDISSNILFDVVPYTLINSTNIIFVINCNYISTRQAIKYLDILVNVWNINKEKISIILNKNNEYSLTLAQIQGLIGNYNIDGVIKYNNKIENILNNPISEFSFNYDFSNFYKKIGLDNNENLSNKFSNFLNTTLIFKRGS